MRNLATDQSCSEHFAFVPSLNDPQGVSVSGSESEILILEGNFIDSEYFFDDCSSCWNMLGLLQNDVILTGNRNFLQEQLDQFAGQPLPDDLQALKDDFEEADNLLTEIRDEWNNIYWNNPDNLNSDEMYILSLESNLRISSQEVNVDIAWNAFDRAKRFYRDLETDQNLLDAFLQVDSAFIVDNIQYDVDNVNRYLVNGIDQDSNIFWTAGAHELVDTAPPAEEPSEGPGDQPGDGGDDNVVVDPQPEPQPNLEPTPILITHPTLTAEQVAQLLRERQERELAETLRKQLAEKLEADRIAKAKANKLAKAKARLAAQEKRRLQAAALAARLAATKARGESLKKKPAWIKLMSYGVKGR